MFLWTCKSYYVLLFSVEVNVDDKKSSIGYTAGWFWDTYKYDLVVGGVNQELEDHDHVTQFQGEIAELIVDDR